MGKAEFLSGGGGYQSREKIHSSAHRRRGGGTGFNRLTTKEGSRKRGRPGEYQKGAGALNAIDDVS